MLKAPQVEQTPLAELRTLLDRVDARVGSLERSTPDDALELMQNLDRIAVLRIQTAADGADLRAEDTRLEALHQILERKAGTLLHLLGRKGGIARLRATAQPPEQSWWWYLDVYENQERRKALRQFAIGVFAVIAFLALAAGIYRQFLTPDPRLIAHLDALNEIQMALQTGKLDQALQHADAGLAEFPGDGELLIWKGAILSLQKKTQEAQAAFAEARPSFLSDGQYWTQRAQTRLQAGDAAGALADAKAAIAAAPESAEAYLALGAVQETTGQLSAAIDSYNIAGDKAGAANQTELQAIAKIRLATLLQGAPLFQQAAPSPTP